MLCQITALGGYSLEFPDGDYMASKVANGRPAEERLLKAASVLAGGGLVVDAGAHAGNHTVYLAKTGCTVVALEPNVVIREYLHRNINCNKLGSRVQVLACGVWDHPAKGVVVAGPKDHTGMARINEMPNGEVDLVALDDLGLSPSLIKIDVEGSEMAALRGARQTVQAHKPAIFVEAHTDLDAVTAMLRPLGYHRLGGHWAQSPTYLFVARRQQLRRVTPQLAASLPIAVRTTASNLRHPWAS